MLQSYIISLFNTAIITTGLILLGALAMLLAIFKTKGLLRIIKGNRHFGRWRLLLVFMVVFFLGYLLVIVGYFFKLNEYYETLIGVIFFMGAVFVYLVVLSGVSTINELRKTLMSKEEKEVMLKELHHRVKNNLQIVISLIHLQSDKLKGTYEREIFNDCENRIQAMALVHENLYKSSNLSTINLSHYLNDLMHHLLYRQVTITYTTNIIEVFLSIDKMVPLGIIINELVSNTIKHAFTTTSSGEISLSYTKADNGKYLLVYSDNGKGYDVSKFHKPYGNSIGLDLVKSLSDQIDGKIEVESQENKGTIYRITFN